MREHDSTLRLWNDTPPSAAGLTEDDIPTLELFPGAGEGPRAAVLVCPGGGYRHLAPHEGAAVGTWLASHGITAAVLRYRLAPRHAHPMPITDAARAIRLLRHDAARLKLDPTRIAVMGFSAGGHLAASLSTGATDAIEVGDAVDRLPSRPDASILIYPVIALDDPNARHTGSLQALSGTAGDHSPELLLKLSPHRHIGPSTPPTFLMHAADDRAVPVSNALGYAAALHQARVPFALHVFPEGGHGFGLAQDKPPLAGWPDLLLSWLRGLGWLDAR
jgi:acetyl esterase/lipase